MTDSAEFALPGHNPASYNTPQDIAAYRAERDREMAGEAPAEAVQDRPQPDFTKPPRTDTPEGYPAGAISYDGGHSWMHPVAAVEQMVIRGLQVPGGYERLVLQDARLARIRLINTETEVKVLRSALAGLEKKFADAERDFRDAQSRIEAIEERPRGGPGFTDAGAAGAKGDGGPGAKARWFSGAIRRGLNPEAGQ